MTLTGARESPDRRRSSACTTGCGLVSGSYPAVQKWTISGSAQLVASETMRGDLGATPWPNYNVQANAGSSYNFVNGGFGTQFIKAGTFKITADDGTVVCQDTNVFAYNLIGGNCTGAGITSSFVNYATGDYQVNVHERAGQHHPLVDARGRTS